MLNNIHWYPGHIAKAERELKEKLSNVDIILEVLDARIPFSSKYENIKKLTLEKPRIVILNKKDKADAAKTKLWKEKIEKEYNTPCIVTNANDNRDKALIIDKILTLSSFVFEKLKSKGLLPRPIRVMVIGMPNVGKSSIINKIAGKAKAKTGQKAGVTRNQQWVRIHKKIELLDTPGIIPTVLNDQNKAAKLAIVNSISQNAYDNEFVSITLIEILKEKYPDELRNYYGFEEGEIITLDSIARKKNWITKGENADITRCAQFVLSNFRDAKIGKFTLDEPSDF